MAKTSLNESVDNFFKSHNLDAINESTIKSSLDINATNNYGNILHAIINYKYEEKAVLKTIRILLDLGVNPNYRGKSTGMTFIHLAFYGYTDDNYVDHPYSEDFIIKLITLAKNYGFDVNIKDNDDETPAIASIASEVYAGSVSNIIAALGSKAVLGEDFKESFEEYLDESKTNPSWNKRLLNEKTKIYKLIEGNNIIVEEIEDTKTSHEEAKDENTFCDDIETVNASHDDIEEANTSYYEVDNEVSSRTSELTSMTMDLDYETLENTYKDISNIIKNILSLLRERKVSEEMSIDAKAKINNSILSISYCLSNEINKINEIPNSNRIESIKPILQEFELSELITLLNQIENDYRAYQDNLRTSAKNIKTINEGNNFLEEIKGIELESVLSEIAMVIIDNLNALVVSLKRCIEEDKKSFDMISSFTDEKYNEEHPDYGNLTKEELEEMIAKINDRTSAYREYVFAYLTRTFDDLSSSIAPILESGMINEEDIKDCLIKSLAKKNQGGNKREWNRPKMIMT